MTATSAPDRGSTRPAPRRMLLVAYYFPPESSSGVYRVLNFLKYLPDYGWEPVILTVRESDYPADSIPDSGLLRRVPATVRVHRTPAWRPMHRLGRLALLLRRSGKAALPRHPPGTPARQESGRRRAWTKVKAHVRGWVTFPDDKIGWLPSAVWKGWRESRRLRNDVILATAGPWTSFLVAWCLHRLTNAPLILDYRDPWTQNPYRQGSSKRRLALEVMLERRIVRAASRVVLNTEELRDVFVQGFPEIAADRFVTITNGFDPSAFSSFPPARRSSTGPLIVTHIGHVYRSRSPEHLLRAIADMRRAGEVSKGQLQLRFVGTSDVDLEHLVRVHELEAFVGIHGFVEHDHALALLAESDVLLLIQSASRLQIPAKLYQYMALGRPVLALTDEGATANLLRRLGLGEICPYDDPAGIRRALLTMTRSSPEPPSTPSPGVLQAFSAPALARRLAAVCAACLGQPSPVIGADTAPGARRDTHRSDFSGQATP